MTSDTPEPGSKNLLTDRFFKTIRNALSRKKDQHSFTSEDYEQLDTSRQDMIRGIFGLADKIVRDIMIPRVDIVAAEVNTSLKQLVKILHDAGHSRLPIYEETIDSIAGVLHAKDLLKLLIEKPKKFQVKKLLHSPYFVPETMALDELLFEFKKRKLHLAIVVDEYGGVDGIVTLEDVLEEIVGEINDEFDQESLPELEKTGEGKYEADSRMPLDDFNAALGLNLPTGDFDTIGGYVFDLFGKVPDLNEEISENGITYGIKDINGTVINRITVTVDKDSAEKHS